MSVVFNVRGDSLTPRYSLSGSQYDSRDVGGGVAPAVTVDASALSGSVITFGGQSDFNFVSWTGWKNFITTKPFSILMRLKASFTGTPSSSAGLFYTSLFGTSMRCMAQISAAGKFAFFMTKSDLALGSHFAFPAATYAASFTSGNFYDILLKTDGTSGSDLEYWLDGVKRDTWSWSEDNSYNTTTGIFPYFSFGADASSSRGFGDMDEFIIWNENISDSLAGTFIGNSRSALYSTTAFDATQSEDPGAANVLSATGYTINGVSTTGSYNPPISSDPGATNVANGTGYTINDVSYTGSAVVLTAGQGASDTLDLNNLKEQIQTILENANTTTGSPVDLSANLANERVKTIGKYNPDKIPTQVSLYPLVTVWIDSKDLEHETIARNQRTGKRKAEVDVKIMGMVFNSNHVTDDADPADEDINYLMENIELTMRAFPQIHGNPIKTSFPESVEYYREWLEAEQTHLRAGVMNYKVIAYY